MAIQNCMGLNSMNKMTKLNKEVKRPENKQRGKK